MEKVLKINVVHLVASNGLYGAEKWILALMRAMTTSMIESVLVNLSDTKNGTSDVVLAANERGLQALDYYIGGSFNPVCIINFTRWLKKNKIDIVHGHGYKSDFIGILAGRLAGCKVVTTPHGWTSDAAIKEKFYNSLDRHLFRFVDYVCPLSEELLGIVKKSIHSKKIKLILNGVDIEEIDNCHAAFRKKQDEFIIGYIGRLAKGKDISTLLYAVKLLHDKMGSANRKKIRLIVIGDGDNSAELKQLANDLCLNDDIEFLGFRYDAISYLLCFDVFVLPSLSEGIPRCLMESMAAGITVVASDIKGNRVLVEHEKTGLLFNAGDQEHLSLMLKYAMENRELCDSLKQSAKALINKNFSNIKMANEYQNLYLRLFR